MESEGYTVDPKMLLESFLRTPGEGTFAPLYECTSHRVWTICIRLLRNDDDARDAFQGAYARLIAIAQARGEAAALLPHHDALTLTSRLAVLESQALGKRRARRQRREVVMEVLPDVPSSTRGPAETAALRERRARLEAAVEQLPEHYAIVVQLHYFHGMTHREIGESLGLETNTVSQRMVRAMEKLEPILRGSGIADSASAFLTIIAATSGAFLLAPPASVSAATIFSAASAAATGYAGAGTAALTEGLLPAGAGTGMAAGTGAGVGGGAAASFKLTVLGAVAAAVVLVTGYLVTTRSGIGSNAASSPPAPQASAPRSGAIHVKPLRGNTGRDQLAQAGTDAKAQVAPPTPAPAVPAHGADTGTSASTSATTASGPGAGPAAKPLAPAIAASDSGTSATYIVVSGRVRTSSGAPIAGARVDVVRAESVILLKDHGGGFHHAVSDVRGEYELRCGIRPPMLRAQAPGHATIYATNAALSRIAASDRKGGELPRATLDFSLPAAAPVRMEVRNTEGEPVAGAQVRSMSWRPPTDTRESWETIGQVWAGITPATGLLSINELAAGAHEFLISADGYAAQRMNVTAPNPNLKVVLKKGGARLAGRLFRRDTGEAVGGAMVSASQMRQGEAPLIATATTNPDGSFEIDSLPPGAFHVSPVPAGGWFPAPMDTDYAFEIELQSDGTYKTTRKSVSNTGTSAAPKPGAPDEASITTAAVVELSAEETKGDIELFVDRGVRIAGRVITKTGETATPVEGATVRIAGSLPGDVATTDADGQFVFPPRARMTSGFTLVATKEGLSMTTFGRSRSPGLVVTGSPLGETSTCVIVMTEGTMITGRVEGPDGMPVVEAEVQLLNLDAFSAMDSEWRRVDSQGRFKIPAEITAGSIRVVSRAPGFGNGLSPLLAIVPGRSVETTISMERGIQVRGRVVNADTNEPVAGVEVQALRQVRGETYSSSKTFATAKTGADGSFVLSPPLAKSEHLLSINSDGYAYFAFTFTPSEPPQPLELKLEPEHFLKGRVVNTEGKPLARVSITTDSDQPARHFVASATTDALGSFHLKRISAKDRTFVLYGPDIDRFTWTAKELDRDDVEIVIDTTAKHSNRRGVITGEVIDAVTRKAIDDVSITPPSWTTPVIITMNGHRFRIERVPGNTHLPLQIAAEGYPNITIVAPTLDPDQADAHMTIELHRSVRLRGRLVTAEGKPALNRLLQPESGDPLSRPLPGSAANTWTAVDANGRFEFASVPAGPITLVVRDQADSVRRERIERIIPDGQPLVDLGDIALAAEGTVTVTLLDANGAPIPNEDIVIVHYGIGSATHLEETARTDANGRIVRANPGAGQLSLRHLRSGVQQSARLEIGQSKDFVLRTGTKSLAVTIRRRGAVVTEKISLDLYRPGTGYSMKGKPSATREGRVEFGAIPPGMYELQYLLRDTSAYRNYGSVAIPSDASDTVAIEYDLHLPCASLSGVVVDASDSPVAGVLVYILGERINAQISPRASVAADRNGAFRFDQLDPGVYGLRVVEPSRGYATAFDIEIPRDTDVVRNLQLVPGDSASLESIAMSQDTEKPNTRAWCKLWAKNAPDLLVSQATRRDSSGKTTISGIPPGEYIVEVSDWGYSASRRELTLEAGKTTTIEDVLYAAGSVAVAVKDAAGNPVAGVFGEATPEDPTSLEAPRRATSNKKGNWEARGLAPGSYRIVLKDSPTGAVLAETTFVIRAKGHTEVSATLNR